MGLFGKSKTPDPKEQVNEWCKKIRKEGYGLDRQIRQIQREEAKVIRSLKQAAKKKDDDVIRILAKEIVHSRRTVTKIYTAKANLNSVEMQMKNQAAQIRLAGTLSKSTEVMKAMQQLVRIPEISATMREMSKEMVKAGILEEMLEDTMESLDDSAVELEDDVQREVDKIISELTSDSAKKMERAPSVPEASIGSFHADEEREDVEDEDEQEDLQEMQERLQALRS